MKRAMLAPLKDRSILLRADDESTDNEAALRLALRQARQYDPQADYVSLWLPELRSVPQHLRHTPFLLSGLQLDALRYPRLEQVPESWKPYLPVAA